MEAFEEKWAKFACTADVDCSQQLSCEGCKEIAKHGFREALEWLLTQHPCGYVRDIIEKELEEK